ncbi:high-affinity nitrate transporter 3.1-like [Cucurbita pepo subsp. pepo]|uniref:high-affinity nitrate transporter 3.1-like n=1 Tax=Cucurbita pepo subsp. pepo TaxID=3664 RepID=UPI000C9D3C22|nr:high-affinity nitrate transporter 3.1-like [Cucurbita pepo subsp. pepo]
MEGSINMSANGFLLAALFLFCFFGFSHGHIHFSSLPRSLEVTASPKPGQVLKAGVDKISVTWILNGTVKSGSDSSYKTVEAKLCYAPVSQVDRAWRKTEDDLSKDKTCQFLIVGKPYNPANKTVQKFEWTVARDIPTGTFFVRAYAFNSAGEEVGYGQTTDNKKGTNLFQIESITGRHISLDIASVCFSAFSVLSLSGFFLAGKRKAKKAEAPGQ